MGNFWGRFGRKGRSFGGKSFRAQGFGTELVGDSGNWGHLKGEGTRQLDPNPISMGFGFQSSRFFVFWLRGGSSKWARLLFWWEWSHFFNCSDFESEKIIYILKSRLTRKISVLLRKLPSDWGGVLFERRDRIRRWIWKEFSFFLVYWENSNDIREKNIILDFLFFK